MAEISLAIGASGAIGPLAAETLFEVKRGVVAFSTDGGTTEVLRTDDSPISFSTGQTVTYANARNKPAAFAHMPL